MMLQNVLHLSRKYLKIHCIHNACKANEIIFRDAVQFLKKWNFDGLDLDYEHPDASDKAGFASWVKELSEAFKPHGYEVICF